MRRSLLTDVCILRCAKCFNPIIQFAYYTLGVVLCREYINKGCMSSPNTSTSAVAALSYFNNGNETYDVMIAHRDVKVTMCATSSGDASFSFSGVRISKMNTVCGSSDHVTPFVLMKAHMGEIKWRRTAEPINNVLFRICTSTAAVKT
jgi:hypothetical protein